jgi:hypothetical protein
MGMNRLDANHYREALEIPTRKISTVLKSVLVARAPGDRQLLPAGAELGGGMELLDLRLLSRPRAADSADVSGAGGGRVPGRRAGQALPLIRGSGIPQIKGELMGKMDAPWASTLAAKFLGGAISILGGCRWAARGRPFSWAPPWPSSSGRGGPPPAPSGA